jgi:hypothetical protein
MLNIAQGQDITEDELTLVTGISTDEYINALLLVGVVGKWVGSLALLLPCHPRILVSRRSWIVPTRRAEQRKKS